MQATRSVPIPTNSVLPLRDARDRIIQILGIGVPYPLRDLPLEYSPMVAVGQTINITIDGGQAGVSYRLCDGEGNDLSGDPYEVAPKGTEGSVGVILIGPEIREDVAYTIMAVRDNARVTPSVPIETYLNQIVEVMVGIDKGLAADFAPDPDPNRHQTASVDRLFLFVDYEEKDIEITLKNSQEGVTYQLFQETWEQIEKAWKEGASLSEPPVNGLGLGNTISLVLKSGIVLQEDTRIKIKATRGSESADLDIRLTIQVRPNFDVVPQADPLILDHNTAPKLTLTGFQPSASYTLYGRSLAPADYHATLVDGDWKIANGEFGTVFIKPLAWINKWEDPAGFVKLGDFDVVSGQISPAALVEDTLFIVRATKIENRESLQLKHAVVVLVRPRPDPTVTARDSLLAPAAEGTVEVRNTQKGVRYQLLKGGGTLVGAPGYHWKDRGVEAMRIGVDFVVEQNEPDGAGGVLWLPTGPLTEKTTFSVMATKVITGVTKLLVGTVVIDIKPPT